MFQGKALSFLKENPRSIVVESRKEAESVAQVARFLGLNYTVLPDFRAKEGDDLRSFKEELFELNHALFEVYHNNALFISPIHTILSSLPKKEYFERFTIEFADNLDLNALKEKLFLWGYEVVDIIQEKGEVSFRGDIVDIFPINENMPVRISLFGDEVESIRLFDEFTQKSSEEIESVSLIPAVAALSDAEYKRIDKKIDESYYDLFVKDFYSLGYWFLEKTPLSEHYFFLKDMTQSIQEFSLFSESYPFTHEVIPNGEYVDVVVKNVHDLLEVHKEKKITLLSKHQTQLKLLNITHSFKESDAIVNVVSKEELIVSLNRAESKERKKASLVLDDLKRFDYVVHDEHGIGRFMGLDQVTVLGKTGEYAVIHYQGEDRLLIPVENLNLIDRYIAPGGVTPALDKLGKGSFVKQKKKIEDKIFSIASDIVKVSAQRDVLTPPALSFEGVEEFISHAGFIYTPDQLKIKDEILTDLKTKVMDRLLSGDVGFGKTEMAMLAAYILAHNGYQVVVVVPTTILVNQHYKSFHDRFKNYNFTLAKLDRFTKPKEKQMITSLIEEGKISITIATHAAFNLTFKNLGLAVIDEEHKFGVKQKEKLKQFVENTHLLSMSATPIPRSLNLALSQIKGFSILSTPPVTKKETRTFVKSYDPTLLKEVISRELRRGGQIFYIYNNIASIEMKRESLLSLMPNLRVLVLHAKLTPNQIEKAMIDFIAGEYDIAVATTIVESGIHIPNVNTVIVENADRFGIADLHQIRGRVGRGKHEGYAYFLVKDKEEITEDAKKRLIALEENSFLGSGAALAMHDLEIRGGGNIIGEAQSGQIKNVGYSMYIKMLEEALNNLSGKKAAHQNVEVKLSINAYLSDTLITEDRIRIEIYRRLSQTKTLEGVYAIEEELIDRFGKLDTYTLNFIEKIRVKIIASSKGVIHLSNYGENITLTFQDGRKELLKSKFKDDEAILETIIKFLKKS